MFSFEDKILIKNLLEYKILQQLTSKWAVLCGFSFITQCADTRQSCKFCNCSVDLFQLEQEMYKNPPRNIGVMVQITWQVFMAHCIYSAMHRCPKI